MKIKKVYFNIRPTSRERMWDTTKYASEICNVVLPNVTQQSSIKTYKKANKFSLMNKLKSEVSKKLINKQKVEISEADKADLIYMWGAFSKNSDKPFILELDNPYSLAYYHIDNFHNNIEKIKQNLRKAQKITYLSQTCMNHTLELLGSEFQEKSFVNYPYMEENYKKNNRDTDIINFIFVGMDFTRKGGDHLLEAFYHTKEKNTRLTFISNVADNIKEKYQNDSRITILPPQPREKLLNEIYPKMDIFVMPSFHESFGVVLLEALSFGMGIITMNTYATPEIVQDGYNGRLLYHPILKPTVLNAQEVINCVDLKIAGFHDRYLKNDEFYYGLYSELKDAINEANSEYKQWQDNSLKLFNEKFYPKVWIKNFSKIIG
jgi:glycosyltransferase involved in cell wall biosynthesis